MKPRRYKVEASLKGSTSQVVRRFYVRRHSNRVVMNATPCVRVFSKALSSLWSL